jgi:hypothetical protein
MVGTRILILILLLQACSTLKSKQKLVDVNLRSYSTKYEINKSMNRNRDFGELILSGNTALDKQSLRKINKKEIRLRLKEWEKAFAFIPDSISDKTMNRIDSFYVNANKIRFIEENNLQSSSIHLLKQPLH